MLSIEEIQSYDGLKMSNKWSDILAKCDLDGNGLIDFHEFFVAAMNESKVLTQQNIKYAFECFDINGDGVIDFREFRSVAPKNIEYSDINE
jgi:Ca2+-binding EF-hand superfamily protein